MAAVFFYMIPESRSDRIVQKVDKDFVAVHHPRANPIGLVERCGCEQGDYSFGAT
jgi:hypothetical protein